MGQGLLEALANLGILGPILAIFGWYIWKQHTTLRESEEKRVADANAVLDRLLSLSNKWHDLQLAQVRVLDANNAALEEIRDALRAVEEQSDFIPDRPSRTDPREDVPSEERVGGYRLVDAKRK